MSSRTDRVLSHRLVAAMGRRATSRRHLRVLAMHGVGDPAAFERQLTQVTSWFQPVSADMVARWYHEGQPLPPRAVWLTFDDGARSTIVDGADALARRGVPATAFVCPGFVEEGCRPWWEVVEAAALAGEVIEVDGAPRSGADAVRALKQVDDIERRRIVEALPARFHEPDEPPVTVADLQRWRDLGGDLGNHTWDHPCLDRCTWEGQLGQIDRAGEWLDQHGLWERRRFAYPNGDRTQPAEEHLRSQGYELVALFDHCLATRRSGPLNVSRLRLDAGSDPVRTAAVTSGWHSGLFHQRRRAQRLVRSRASALARSTG